MYRPSLWFVALNMIPLTAALLAGKSYLLVFVAMSFILLGYGYAAVLQGGRRNATVRAATIPAGQGSHITRVFWG